MSLILLTLVCIFTYTFEIVFGLAGTILLLTLLTWLYDAKTLVIYSTLPQILVGTIGLARSPRTVRYVDSLHSFINRFPSSFLIAGAPAWEG